MLPVSTSGFDRDMYAYIQTERPYVEARHIRTICIVCIILVMLNGRREENKNKAGYLINKTRALHAGSGSASAAGRRSTCGVVG